MFQIYSHKKEFALFFDEIEIGSFPTLRAAKAEAAHRKGAAVRWIRCPGWWEGK